MSADIDFVSVALLVVDPELDPEQITALLRRKPTFAALRGADPEGFRAGLTDPPGIWIYELPRSPEWELADALDTLLSLFPDDPGVWASLHELADLHVVCHLVVAGPGRDASLPPQTLDALAARHLSLGIQLTAPGHRLPRKDR